MRRSPRRAFCRAASSMRARMTPSSNSLMLPFMPSCPTAGGRSAGKGRKRLPCRSPWPPPSRRVRAGGAREAGATGSEQRPLAQYGQNDPGMAPGRKNLDVSAGPMPAAIEQPASAPSLKPPRCTASTRKPTWPTSSGASQTTPAGNSTPCSPGTGHRSPTQASTKQPIPRPTPDAYDRKTIRVWLQAGGPSLWRKPPHVGVLAPWLGHIEQRWTEGCRNAALLWRELVRLGFAACRMTAQRQHGKRGRADS